jgi:hypothetical protein
MLTTHQPRERIVLLPVAGSPAGSGRIVFDQVQLEGVPASRRGIRQRQVVDVAMHLEAGSRQQSSSSRPARRCFSDPGVHRARQNVSVELSLRVSPAPDRPSGPGAGCSQLVAALSLGRMSRPALSRTQDPPSASLSSIRECANSRANNSYGSELRSIKPRHTEEAK